MQSMKRPELLNRITRLILVGSLCVAAWHSPSAYAADWPTFRGPGARGQSSEYEVIPPSEPFSLKIAWKVPIGRGYSAVVIAEGVACTGYTSGEKDVLACFDLAKGEKKWSLDIEPTYEAHDGSHGGPITTPCIDKGRIFMLGAHGRLVAADLKTGELIWSKDLGKDFGTKTPFYGFGTSPIVVDGVLVAIIGAADSFAVGLNPATGEKIWAAGSDEIGYQTPVLGESSGKPIMFLPGSRRLYAANPADGKIVWEYKHNEGEGRGAGTLIPVSVGPNRLFLANKEETSCVVEWKEGAEGGPEFKQLWETRSIRNSYNIPVYLDGHLYAYSNRFLTCVDVSTGEPKWRSRDPGDGFIALVDNHLIIATKEGSLDVVRATPKEYEHRATLPIFKDVTWANPSFSNGRIYARSQGELACVEIVHGKVELAANRDKEGQLADSDFGRFVASLSKAEDKKSAIDAYLAKHKSFPILEGDNMVHFVYRGEGTDLAVAGDMFGARQERPMIHVEGTDLFYFSMRTEPDARMNYIFMRDFSTIKDPANPRSTVTTLVNAEMEMSFDPNNELPMSWFAMPKWTEPKYLSAQSAESAGKWESHELESEALGKKHKIEVYLPKGYESSDKRYPVAYLFGGDEAVKHGALKESLDSLCGKQVEPLIAVLINESTFRQKDKLPKMFADELVPFVDKTYRTVATPDGRAAIGAGFAGTDAWFCALSHPELVGKLGGQSLFVFDAFTPNIRSLFKPASEQPLTVYLEWGKYDFRNPHEAWDMARRNHDIAEELKSKGYRIVGGEVHDGTGWSSWKNRTDQMLTALFGKKS